MDIRKLMLNADSKESNEYKEGWNNAVCYLNDNFCITKRNGEPIQINFELALTENEIIQQGVEKCKKNSKLIALMRKFLVKRK